jgi:long-subunit fatty acid transport protein
MKLKIIGFLAGFYLLGTTLATAQPLIDPAAFGNYHDAYLISRQNMFSSARMMGIGGARTALGGDIGTISANPAGLGFFNKSEFSFTGGLAFNNANTDFLNRESREGIGNFNLPNLGLVLNYSKDDIVPGKWRGGSFGVSINRLANFQQEFTYQGLNNQNSLIDFYLERAQQYDPNQLNDEINNNAILSSDVLGYATYLVDYGQWFFNPGDSFPRYSSEIPTPDSVPMLQEETVRRRGSVNQIDIAYGANYDDKIYLGASLGIQTLRMLETKTYKETSIQIYDSIGSPLNSFTLRDEYNLSGTGVNLTVGMIIRPVDVIRLGVTYRSPTIMGVNSTFNSTLDVRYNNWNYISPSAGSLVLNDVSASTVPGSFGFNVVSPHRINVGAAIFVGKHGFLTGDLEMVAFNNAELRARDNTNFGADNRTISRLYQPVMNIRLGGEFRMDKFRFRAGYALMPSGVVTTQEAVKVNRDITSISAGIGYRTAEYYIDVAVVNQRFEDQYSPYTLNMGDNMGKQPVAVSRFNNTQVSITYGAFF